jgi:glycosyltransferase involved in cell wall biosynthesis
MGGLRCLALVAAFNEADIIESFLTHCGEQGIAVYLLDDGSSDGTLERARAHGGGALVGWEHFASRAPARYELARILARKQELALELGADWTLHLDADELAEPVEAGRTLVDVLDEADALGCNALRFRVLELVPEPGSRFPAGGDPRRLLTRWKVPDHASYEVRTTAFRSGGKPVDLVTSGGHEVEFAGRRVYPPRQLLRHYPLRDAEHAARKVLRERKPRWERERRKYQWHVHYDHLSTVVDVERALVAAAADARRFDDETRMLLARLNAEEIARESLALHDELERRRAEAELARRNGHGLAGALDAELRAVVAGAWKWRTSSPLIGRLERSYWRLRRRVLASARGRS